MADHARVVRLADTPWLEELPEDPVLRAAAGGVQRKRLAERDGVLRSVTWVEMEANKVVDPHSHQEAELIVPLAGTMMIEGLGAIGAGDCAIIPPGVSYGFSVGGGGCTFLNLRLDHSAS